MRAVLVISDRDNVATALEPLETGRTIEANGVSVVVLEPVPAGHKIALRTIVSGDGVFKYGSPIGTATQEIAAGAHVHTHNVASSRGRGDLPLTPADPRVRPAEPPDVPQTAPTHQ
jgi:SAF domain-containing protein